jgi:hypothetical protein
MKRHAPSFLGERETFDSLRLSRTGPSAGSGQAGQTSTLKREDKEKSEDRGMRWVLRLGTEDVTGSVVIASRVG